MSNEFGGRLKYALKQAGYTQKSATEELKLSKNAISNYVAGRIPEATILYQLSKLCAVTMEWLLTGEENNSLQLSAEEEDLVKQYRMLDRHNQILAKEIINSQYNLLKKKLSSELTNGSEEEAAGIESA